jgi:hypothetical protein
VSRLRGELRKHFEAAWLYAFGRLKEASYGGPERVLARRAVTLVRVERDWRFFFPEGPVMLDVLSPAEMGLVAAARAYGDAMFAGDDSYRRLRRELVEAAREIPLEG